MKKVLMNITGFVHEIRNPGEDYEIYEGPDATIAWVDAPDDITYNWTLEYSPAAKEMIWVKRIKPYANPAIERKVAYGDVGDQLDMIYKDMKNGTTHWIDHIDFVKSVIPKPPPYQESPELEELMAIWENSEPDPTGHPKLSEPALPCWVRFPGWKGYKTPDHV